MSEIVRHMLTVLPEFTLACLAVAALPGLATALFLHRTVRDGRAAELALHRRRGRAGVPRGIGVAQRAPRPCTARTRSTSWSACPWTSWMS